jgi:hypothetical protein
MRIGCGGNSHSQGIDVDAPGTPQDYRIPGIPRSAAIENDGIGTSVALEALALTDDLADLLNIAWGRQSETVH